jgi:hypothetical protein
MTASIYSGNIAPNQRYFVKIGPDAGAGLVELFNLQADAEGDVSRVAYGTFAFGYAQEVILTNDTEDPEIALFTDQDAWHLRVTLLEGDPEAIIRYGPVTDRGEILDPLLVDPQPLLDRGTYEVDEGTHAKIERTITLGTHIQELECIPPVDKRKLTDNMRGLNQQVRVDDIQIKGGIQDKKVYLIDIIQANEFKDVKR